MLQDLWSSEDAVKALDKQKLRAGTRDIWFINKGVEWGQAGCFGESEDHTAGRSQEKASEGSQTFLHSLPLPTQGRQLWSSPQVLEVGTKEVSSPNLLGSACQP